MAAGRIISALMLLKERGHSKLANKIYKAITIGKTANLTSAERKAFLPFRGTLTGTKPLKNPIIQAADSDFTLRKEMGFQPFAGNILRKTGPYKGKGHGAYGRGLYGEQKKVPITDIDLYDPSSHAADQVVFKTLKDFTPAMRDFMKTKRGKQSAFKIYRTPAGLRVFDVSKVSRRERPLVYDEVWQALGADPRYTNMAISKGAYATRLHPKQGRRSNIWGLPGNVRTGKFSKENPGDFVAKQKYPGAILKGPDAIIDPKSLREVDLYHDNFIKVILHNKLQRGNISLDGLLKYINMTTL